MRPTFDLIPVVQDSVNARIRALTLSGISTKHGATSTSRGSLFGSIALTGGSNLLLELFSDPAKSEPSLVAAGESIAAGSYFAIGEENASNVDGRAVIDSGQTPAEMVVIVSFSVDEDIFSSLGKAASMPGYDEEYGLAKFHAAAARRIVSEILPSIVPSLYAGSSLTAFTPDMSAVALPDLRKVINASALRELSACLAKAESASEFSHIEEFANMAENARERASTIIANLTTANAPANTESEVAATGGISFGTFTRG